MVTSSPGYRDITHIGQVDVADPRRGLARLMGTARAVHRRAARCAIDAVRVSACRVETETATRGTNTVISTPALDDRCSAAAAPREDPLSSAGLRYELRSHAVSDAPGPAATRPLALRFATTVATPARPVSRSCPERQIAIGEHGYPLADVQGKEWESKFHSDGDEGKEEEWGWRWEER